MSIIELTRRQNDIIEIVKKNQPITSEQIAEHLDLTRGTLRTDLAVLTMLDILDARPKVGYFYTEKTFGSILKKQVKELTVEEVKSLPIVVTEESTAYDAIVTLFLEDVGTIFVQNKEKVLSGVVSRKDFLKIAIGNHDIHKIPVAMIMTRMPNIIYTYGYETIYKAALRIIEHEVDSLPVVEKFTDENNSEKFKITGKISKTNITQIFVNSLK